QHHVRAWLYSRVQHSIRVVEIDVLHLDGQSATSRHRVAGIHCQVQDDLLDLSRVRSNIAHILPRRHDKVDVFTNQSLKHPLHFVNDGLQIQHVERHDLSTAE